MKPYIFLALLICCTSALFAGDIKTLVLQPGPQDGFDAYINSRFPDEAGWDKGLLVTAWTLGGEPYVGKSLLRFDLSQLGNGDSIISAKLSLFFDPQGSWPEQSGLNEGHIRRVTGNWDFMTVTWNTQPAVCEYDKIYLPQSTQPQQDYTDIDVTGYARLWQKDVTGNHGMMVSLDTQTPYACLVFAPSDRDIPAVRPKLVITYINCKPPVARFDFIVDGFDVGFKDRSSPVQSWLWDFGDGQTSAEQNPMHHYTSAGTYLVSLLVQDSCGQASFKDSAVIKCIPPRAGFSYNLDFPVYTFHDTSVSFNHLTWYWDFGDGLTSPLKDPRHVYMKQGNYKVCLRVTDTCSSDTACTKINFILPAHGFKMEQNTENDFEVSFTDMTTGSTGWQWSFGDGDSSMAKNPVHIYKDYGDYLVCLKAQLPGKDSTSCGTLSLKSLNPGYCSVQVFPNPAESGVIHLLFTCNEAYADISVNDMFGHMVYSKQIGNIISNNKIDLFFPQLSSGIYFLKVNYPAGSRLVKMVIQ